MVISSLIPAEVSAAVTDKIPSASISKVTSIYGTPLGASGIPVRSNLPNKWLCSVMGLSPSKI